MIYYNTLNDHLCILVRWYSNDNGRFAYLLDVHEVETDGILQEVDEDTVSMMIPEETFLLTFKKVKLLDGNIIPAIPYPFKHNEQGVLEFDTSKGTVHLKDNP